MHQQKQLNIGLQVVSLSDSYNKALIESINTIADKLNVNLILFLGRTPNHPNFTQEHHQRIIYDHINSDNVDAIIFLTAALSNFLSETEFKETLKKLSSIPIISVGLDISKLINNQSSILINSESGFNKLMNHLIKEQGYTNLAFITGPLTNPEAILRFDVYKKALTDANIEINENNIFYGTFDSEDAKPAVAQFLKNKTLPQVIICSNDHCAIGVLDELSKHNIRVPQQIAVTGFDNIDETTICSPPLTTVAQSLLKIGDLAMQLAVRHALNQPCHKTYTLETVLIKRQSSGNNSAHETKNLLSDNLNNVILDPILSSNDAKEEVTKTLSNCELLTLIMDELFTHTKDENDQSLNVFEKHYLPALKKRFRFDIQLKSGYKNWIKSINDFEKENIENSDRNDIILLKIRGSLLKEFDLLKNTDVSSRDNIVFVKEIIDDISSSSTFSQLNETINYRYQQLSHFINLENYVVLAYPEPVKNFIDKPWVSPKTIDVILSFNQHKIKHSKGLDSKYLFPKELAPNKDRYTIVVETLYSADLQLGRVVYELYPREIDLYSCAMITAQIASTIRIIHQSNERNIAQKEISLLVSDLEHKKQVAEEAVHAKGRFLATMSHEIRTPMNGVLGLTELLKDTKLDDLQNEYLDIIQNSSHSLYN